MGRVRGQTYNKEIDRNAFIMHCIKFVEYCTTILLCCCCSNFQLYSSLLQSYGCVQYKNSVDMVVVNIFDMSAEDEQSNSLADKDKNSNAFVPYCGLLSSVFFRFYKALGISSPKKVTLFEGTISQKMTKSEVRTFQPTKIEKRLLIYLNPFVVSF